MTEVVVSQRACDECRRLHRKCDFREPSCGFCKENGRVCSRGGHAKVRFKRAALEHDFPRSQQWAVLPRNRNCNNASVFPHPEITFIFIDETIETSREYCAIRPSYHHVRTEWMATASHQELEPSPDASEESLPARLVAFGSSESALDNLDLLIRPLSATGSCHWPLRDSTEIMLFQHFTKTLSCFFDFCDRERHFAIQVPQRAKTCPPLLDAILALSARHLSRIDGQFDTNIADRFYQRCLEALIAGLGSYEDELHDDLLAATVILRLLEELDVPLAGPDPCQHSVGTRAFLRSQAAPASPVTSLRRAASWAGVRQEIYVSLCLHRQPAVKATPDMLASLDSASDDCAWANRAVSLCSDVLDFCFAEAADTVKTFDALLARDLQWHAERPPSYDPYGVGSAGSLDEPQDSPFRNIRLLADWHVMGWQYWALARLLLVTHDPYVPRIGLGRQASWSKVNDRARAAVKLLCSIAQSNPATPPATVVACMGIKMCGDLFRDACEQEGLMGILVQAEAAYGWPTKEIQIGLSRVWKGHGEVDR